MLLQNAVLRQTISLFEVKMLPLLLLFPISSLKFSSRNSSGTRYAGLPPRDIQTLISLSKYSHNQPRLHIGGLKLMILVVEFWLNWWPIMVWFGLEIGQTRTDSTISSMCMALSYWFGFLMRLKAAWLSIARRTLMICSPAISRPLMNPRILLPFRHARPIVRPWIALEYARKRQHDEAVAVNSQHLISCSFQWSLFYTTLSLHFVFRGEETLALCRSSCALRNAHLVKTNSGPPKYWDCMFQDWRWS